MLHMGMDGVNNVTAETDYGRDHLRYLGIK